MVCNVTVTTEALRLIEGYHLLGYNAVQSIECQPTFRGNISPTSSGSKNKLIGVRACDKHAGLSLSLFFDPEDGGIMFFRNVGRLSADYTALYPRRCYASELPLRSSNPT
jgi:hypothetical protein